MTETFVMSDDFLFWDIGAPAEPKPPRICPTCLLHELKRKPQCSWCSAIIRRTGEPPTTAMLDNRASWLWRGGAKAEPFDDGFVSLMTPAQLQEMY